MLADIMAYVPWPGFGPYESYDADETVRRRRDAASSPGSSSTCCSRPATAPATSPTRSATRTRSSPATSSSRARSAASTCPAATGPTLLESIGLLLDSLPEQTAVYPGHMGTTTLGAERATNPFLPPRQLSAGARRAKVAAMASKYQAPRGTFDVLPEQVGRASAVERAAAEHLRPRRLRADRDAELRGHRTVRTRGRQVDRHRPQGDVHLRGQGRAQPHPAARGHGADLPRLRRARHAQTARSR